MDSASGELGKALKEGFMGAYESSQKAWQAINQLAAAVGGFENLAKLALTGIAAIMTCPLLLAVVQLGLAFAASPILLAIGLITAALILLWRNWAQVVAGFKNGIEAIKNWFINGLMGAINLVKFAFGNMLESVSAVGAAIGRVMSFKSPFSSAQMFPSVAPVMGKPVAALAGKTTSKADVGCLASTILSG